MKVDELEKIINDAFEDRKNISETSDKKILDAINQTIDFTDKGSIRVAEKKNGKWSVNQWVKKAILLSFRTSKMTMSKGPYTTWYDKVPGKTVKWQEKDWKKKVRYTTMILHVYAFQNLAKIISTQHLNTMLYITKVIVN